MEEVNSPKATDSAWYESETAKPVNEVTMPQFEQLCTDAFDQRAVIDKLEDGLKIEKAKLTKMEMQITTYLQEMKWKNHRTSKGLLILAEKKSWSLPKTDADKAQFFDFLRKQGIFDAMATVHSSTFNAFLKEQFELAEKEGRSADFKVPGVGEPSVFHTLRFKGD